jgi:hypothetical protein
MEILGESKLEILTHRREMFSKHVAEKLNNYVYRLIDPRNGETFYIGKALETGYSIM